MPRETRTHGLVGFEVLRLDEFDPKAPWRMTVDTYEDGEMVRYQVTGKHYENHIRTVDEVAGFIPTIDRDEARVVAEKFNEIDLRYGKQMAELTRQMQREQIEALYGQEGLDLLDQEEAGER